MSSVDVPQRWPLVTSPLNRGYSTSFDGKIVNGFAELNPQFKEYDVIRRPAVRPSFLTATNQGRGIYIWSTLPGSNVVIQVRWTAGTADVYSGNTIIGTVANAFYDGFQPVESSPRTLFFKGPLNGAGYITDGGTVTQIVDATWVTFGSGLLYGSASLNGRLYVLVAPNAVYGAANLDDATVWSALNVIKANDNPDPGVAISRHLQYIIILKTLSCETFEDTGNATGSPLSRVPGVRIPYGCSNAASIASVGDRLFWIGPSNDTSPSPMSHVIMLVDLQPTIVSTPYISRLVDQYSTILAAFSFANFGHQFYCVQCQNAHDSTQIILVYDLTTELWYEWDIPGTFYMATGGGVGVSYLLQQTSGIVLSLTSLLYSDNVGASDLAITLDIYTPNMDFGVDRSKSLYTLYINADQASTGKVKVRRSDNDYQNWSNFREVDLSKEKPRLTDEGSFYKRAYNLRYEGSLGPARLRSLGLQMDIGVL